MNKYIIGGGAHAASVVSCALAQKLKIKGILELETRCENILGCPIYNEAEHQWSQENLYIIALRDRLTKENILGKIHKKIKNPKFFNLIHPTSYIAQNVQLGSGLCILANTFVGPNTIVGNHTCINTGCVIEHDCVIGANIFMGPAVTLAGNVNLGSGSFVGMNASISENVTVAERTIIGANSLILKNIDRADRVVFGSPGKYI